MPEGTQDFQYSVRNIFQTMTDSSRPINHNEEIAYNEAQDYVHQMGFRNAIVAFTGTEENRQLNYIFNGSGGLYTTTQKPTPEVLEDLNLININGFVVKEEDTVVCVECGERILADDAIFPQDNDENAYCQECANDTLYHCDRCGNYYETDCEVSTIYNQNDDIVGEYCSECRTRTNVEWDDSAGRYYLNGQGGRVKRFLDENSIIAGNFPDCPDCDRMGDNLCPRHMRQKAQEIEKEATTAWVYDTGRRNYHEDNHRRFKNLKYRLPNEHPYLYYGIELEVVWPSNRDLKEVTKEFIKKTGGLFVAEYDRSVDNFGMSNNMVGSEFISRPTSYQRWIHPDTIKTLQKGLDYLKSIGASVNQFKECGLHVHMSKAFFEKNLTKKKNAKTVKSDMDWFFQYFQPEIEKFSRREYNNYCASKALNLKRATGEVMNNNNIIYGIKGKFVMEKGDLVVSRGSGDTHHCCVIDAGNTIEARTFRSTLDVNTIMATIELCRGLAHAARKRNGLADRTFGDIIGSSDSKYLFPYIQKQKIDTSRKLKNKLEVKL